LISYLNFTKFFGKINYITDFFAKMFDLANFSVYNSIVMKTYKFMDDEKLKAIMAEKHITAEQLAKTAGVQIGAFKAVFKRRRPKKYDYRFAF